MAVPARLQRFSTTADPAAPPAEMTYDPATEPLVTINDLSIVAFHASGRIASDDDFALWCINNASLLVRDAGDPAWTETTAPPKARLITVMVAKRAYINNDGEVRSNVGPIGSSILEIEAIGMRLTDAERAEIAALAPDVAVAGTNQLWVQPIETGQPASSELYLFDSSFSDWGIPYIDANDPVGQKVMGVE